MPRKTLQTVGETMLCGIGAESLSTEDTVLTAQHAGERHSSGTCDLCIDGVIWIKTPEGVK